MTLRRGCNDVERAFETAQHGVTLHIGGRELGDRNVFRMNPFQQDLLHRSGEAKRVLARVLTSSRGEPGSIAMRETRLGTELLFKAGSKLIRNIIARSEYSNSMLRVDRPWLDCLPGILKLPADSSEHPFGLAVEVPFREISAMSFRRYACEPVLPDSSMFFGPQAVDAVSTLAI